MDNRFYNWLVEFTIPVQIQNRRDLQLSSQYIQEIGLDFDYELRERVETVIRVLLFFSDVLLFYLRLKWYVWVCVLWKTGANNWNGDTCRNIRSRMSLCRIKINERLRCLHGLNLRNVNIQDLILRLMTIKKL